MSIKQINPIKTSNGLNGTRFYLKIRVLDHVFGSHSVQNEFRFISNTDNVILHGVREQPVNNRDQIRLKNFPVLTSSHSSSSLLRIANYRPSLISSMKASPAFFCNEFCHSCEHSNITNSTTDWLCLKVINPAFDDG